LLFGGFVAVSLVIDLPFGVAAAKGFVSFSREMLLIVPAAFVLIGLFEVWVPRDRVERHLGEKGGIVSHVWSVLLAGTTVGGLVVAIPVSLTLRRKGARFAVIFSYLGAAGIARVPMTLFEISFLGLPFTAVRYVIALPLVIVTAELIGRTLDHRGYEMREGS
jgi:uncharacterized membrane protein YraQ (UPF0718 family)